MTRSHLPQFPAAGLAFLRKLKRNNRREWFLKNKPTYEEYVHQPMIELVNALAAEFATFAPEIVASPKVSLYRIYRDTRFSKDKSPYKTHVAAVFPHRNLEKGQGAGLYLHITPSEFLIGGGMYNPQSEDLAAVRHHISLYHKQLTAILNARRFRHFFGGLKGEQLLRVPRGFPADHAAADYLRHKQFLAMRLLPAAKVTTPQFGSVVLESFRALYPLIELLNEPIIRLSNEKHRRSALMS
ncbi:MAG TPA: DUF2461 domain-containing protein [Terriglobia bacterium]|nr:DUF2461 domain-containing protein [Terriglobia bacterium]